VAPRPCLYRVRDPSVTDLSRFVAAHWRGRRSAKSPTAATRSWRSAPRATSSTFGALAKEYLDSYARPNKRSWREDERQLNASLLPKWKTRPAAEISASREHCEARAKNLASAGAPWV